MSTPQLARLLDYLKSDPENVLLITSAADAAYQAGELAQAQQLAEQAININSEHVQAKAILGLSLLAQGQIPAAKNIFQALLDAQIDDPAIRYNLAYCLALEQNYSEALALLDDAEQQYENTPHMLHLKVQLLHFLAEIEPAIAVAQSGLASNPNDAHLHGLLSTLYIDDANFSAAKLHSKQALALGNVNADAYASLGTVALAEQDSALASEYFLQSIQAKPSHSRAWLGKAMTEMLAKDFVQAETSLHNTLQYMPKHLGSWQVLIWCYLAQNKIEEAEATTHQAIETDPNFSESHGALAIIQLIKGQQEAAQLSIRKSLGLDKESFSGLFAQAILLQAQGNVEATQKIMQGLLNTEVLPNQGTLESIIKKYM